MHPYIPYLLSDIKAAHRIEIPITPVREMSFEEQMEEIEEWVEVDPPHTFGYFCGLESANFPPPEQLTKKDMNQVCKAFEQMMLTWNFCIDLPNNLPAALRYSLLIKNIDEKTTITNGGITHIDYCSGYAPDCPLKEYCCCLEFWNSLPDDEMNDTSYDPNELPF